MGLVEDTGLVDHHLLKISCYFALLVLKAIYHNWKYVCRGLKQMEAMLDQRLFSWFWPAFHEGQRAHERSHGFVFEEVGLVEEMGLVLKKWVWWKTWVWLTTICLRLVLILPCWFKIIIIIIIYHDWKLFLSFPLG